MKTLSNLEYLSVLPYYCFTSCPMHKLCEYFFSFQSCI